MKKRIWMKRIGYLLFLFFFTLLALEIILRIYNPFPAKFIGNKFVMPANTHYVLENDLNTRLDRICYHNRNKLGFRGPELHNNMNDCLSMIAVGGSTTSCTFLSEGQTWCDWLQQKLQTSYPSVWVNNAGVDGHSTYNHLSFFYNYFPKLSFKPQIILFLVGANEIDKTEYDSTRFVPHDFRWWLQENSEAVHFLYFLKNSIKPHNVFNNQTNWSFSEFKKVYPDSNYTDSALRKQTVMVTAYRQRLNKLVDICLDQHIQPLLITQPAVCGDSNPAIDFHVFHQKENGRLLWQKLKLYNEVTKEVALQRNVPYVDLAGLLPKDTTYFCDIIHYSKEGAEKVAAILAQQMNPFLQNNYQRFHR